MVHEGKKSASRVYPCKEGELFQILDCDCIELGGKVRFKITCAMTQNLCGPVGVKKSFFVTQMTYNALLIAAARCGWCITCPRIDRLSGMGREAEFRKWVAAGIQRRERDTIVDRKAVAQ